MRLCSSSVSVPWQSREPSISSLLGYGIMGEEMEDGERSALLLCTGAVAVSSASFSMSASLPLSMLFISLSLPLSLSAPSLSFLSHCLSAAVLPVGFTIQPAAE